MKKMRDLIDRVRGSGQFPSDDGVSAVLVALSMFVLLGMGAMALDIGNTYQERRLAQNAADHAALTAAYTECTGGADPVGAGLTAALENGFDDADADVSVSVTQLGPNEYMAEISTDLDATFGKVLGASQLGTSVSAVVSCSGGTFGGTTLHAHSNDCSLHPELLVTGDSVEVHGGSHSNGDFRTSGDDVELYDGATNGLEWQDTADNTIVDPNTPGDNSGPSDAPWPYPYDIEDYNDASDFAAGFFHDHGSGNVTLSGSIPAGVHYVDGNFTINDITIAPVSGETGVTFVAEGSITTITDTLDIHPYSGANAMLMFANNLTECDSNLDDDLAINSQTDNATYDGVLFAPRGKILLRSDGALSVAIWGYFVELRGDPNITLSFPATAPAADPEMVFEQ